MSTHPAFTRRPARADDLDFAWTLYRRLMKPLTEPLMTWRDEAQRAVVARDLASDGAEVILVEGAEVGWLRLRVDEDWLELCQLYVAPKYQNRGIGGAVVEQLKARADAEGIALELQVMVNNRAEALYRRLGFREVDRGPIKITLRYTP